MISLRDWFSRVDQKLTKKSWARFAWYALFGLLLAGLPTLLRLEQLSALESESATNRNFAFVAIALTGLALVTWRGTVPDR